MAATVAGYRRGRISDAVRVGQRWRREDGLVILIRQVHRADEEIEAKPVEPGVPARFPVSFIDLRNHYEMLVSFR